MAHNNKRILVTGAAGLIGNAVYKELCKNNEVTGIDNFTRSNAAVDVIHTDVISFLKSDTSHYDYIYHFAATNGTTSFYDNPNHVLHNNVTLDMDVINYAAKYGSKLIYASSSEVVAGTDIFPTPEQVDVTISDIHNPRWSYRLPKILTENYLMNSENIDFVIIRFFNVISENSQRGHFIKDITDKLNSNNFDIVGADETRSFCHIDDIVPAIIELGETQNKEVFNLGSDNEVSILDAANIIAAKLGKTPTWNKIESRTGSVQRRCPDITKLRNLIDYNPRTFEEIMDEWTFTT
jgi:nucleoside-diphosphate-sugar epimerase